MTPPATNHAEIPTPRSDGTMPVCKFLLTTARELERELHQATAQLSALEECNRGLRELLTIADQTNASVAWYGTFPNRAESYRDRCLKLLAQTPASVSDDLAALRKDRERIDRLEKLAAEFGQDDWRITIAPGQQHRLIIRTGHKYAFSTLRAAIDAMDARDAARTQEKHP